FSSYASLLYSLITAFLFIDPATTEIYTLSLHDALPICQFGKSQLRQDHSDNPEGNQDKWEQDKDRFFRGTSFQFCLGQVLPFSASLFSKARQIHRGTCVSHD